MATSTPTSKPIIKPTAPAIPKFLISGFHPIPRPYDAPLNRKPPVTPNAPVPTAPPIDGFNVGKLGSEEPINSVTNQFQPEINPK